MEYLPDHILEEIFDYLSPSELLNTTLVSTKLNETISSTKRLTEKLNLYLSLIEDIEPKKNFSSLIRSSRKYHKFKISLDCGFDDFIPYEEDFFNVLKKLNYIKKFELVHSKLSYRNLIKIFSFFECLESIKLRDVVVYEGEDFKFGEPLKFSRLKELIFECVLGANDQLLGRFYKADLNSFSIVKSKLHRYGADFLFLVEMLRLQKNLKKLRIGGYFKNTDFTDKAICFKLESLEMEYCIFDEFWEFYREFLERQDKLKHFGLKSVRMDNDLALMFQARRLDTLKSVALDVGLSEPWHTSILTINDKISVGSFACTFTDVKYVNHLMVTIPNLQKLDVRFEITPDLAKQMSQSIKKLKHLEVKSRLESHVLQSFRFSQLESFEGIILLKNENDIFKFTKSCSKIRILVIRYLAKSDHSQKNFSIVKIVDNITKNLKDLKHLEIDCGDCRKTEKVRDLIEKVIRNSPHLLCLKLSGLFDPVKPSQYMRLAEEMPLINFEIIEH